MNCLKGGFTYAGDVYCPHQTAIWNSTHWIGGPVLPEFKPWSNAVCTAISNYFAVSYYSFNETYDELVLALINIDTWTIELYNYPDYGNYITTLSLSTSNTTLYTIGLTQGMYEFDIISHNWTITSTF